LGYKTGRLEYLLVSGHDFSRAEKRSRGKHPLCRRLARSRRQSAKKKAHRLKPDKLGCLTARLRSRRSLRSLRAKRSSRALIRGSFSSDKRAKPLQSLSHVSAKKEGRTWGTLAD